MTECPACGSADTVEIVYGMPSPELVEEMASGEMDVVLGGCCVMVGESPSHYCRGCGRDFGVYEA